MKRPLVRIGVPLVLAVLTALGLWLVFTGTSASDDPGSTGSGSPGSGSTERLSIGETDLGSVSELAGLVVPDSVDDFTTARLDDDSQLDVSFTIAGDEEAGFLEGSGLPEPQEDQRVITHASPLWDLNVGDTIRGSADTAGDVTRAVELVPEGERVRVRLVLTPAG